MEDSYESLAVPLFGYCVHVTTGVADELSQSLDIYCTRTLFKSQADRAYLNNPLKIMMQRVSRQGEGVCFHVFFSKLKRLIPFKK